METTQLVSNLVTQGKMLMYAQIHKYIFLVKEAMMKVEASIFNLSTSHLQIVPMARPTTPCMSCIK